MNELFLMPPRYAEQSNSNPVCSCGPYELHHHHKLTHPRGVQVSQMAPVLLISARESNACKQSYDAH